MHKKTAEVGDFRALMSENPNSGFVVRTLAGEEAVLFDRQNIDPMKPVWAQRVKVVGEKLFKLSGLVPVSPGSYTTLFYSQNIVLE